MRTALLIAFVFFSACFLAVRGIPLPTVTPIYSTYVSAGFDNLLFSFHYQEFGNTTGGISMMVGRYLSPLNQEFIDVPLNQIQMLYTTGTTRCATYSISEVADTRIVLPAVFLLTGLQTDGINFTNAGPTQSVRAQNSVLYTTQLAWNSNSGTPPPSSTLAQLLLQAYVMAGVDTSGVFSFAITLDVYFSSDSSGNLLLAQGGAMPLRFSINGWSNNGQTRNIDIVYDFFQWYALDSANYGNLADLPTQTSVACPVAFGLPPAVTAGALLPATEGPPRWLGSGLSTIELSASNAATMQVYAVHNLEHGQERLDFLVDPNLNVWDSNLYYYYFNDERDFRFQNGAVYLINNSHDSANYGYGFPSCNGAPITATTASPLQWTDAANLNTLFADGAQFFKNATFAGRQTFRGITTDSWSVKKIIAYSGVLYDYTVTVYAEANGWANLGREGVHITPEIVRVYYNGTMFLTSGLIVSYWLQLDFFTQFFATFIDTNDANFDLANFFCTAVPTDGSVLPVMPPQYSATISAAYQQYWYSTQYTEYVDTTRNAHRIDGRFAAPNTFTLISPTQSSGGMQQVTVEEWTNNVTLAAGFSEYTLSNNLPYMKYQKSNGGSCAATTVNAAEFNASATISFFYWLAIADPSLAVYLGEFTHRGVTCDLYQVSYVTKQGPLFSTTYHFSVYYLSGDETTTATIPLSAEVDILVFRGIVTQPVNIFYEFFNFRQVLPVNIFNAPPVESCVDSAPLPATTQPIARQGIPSTTDAAANAPTWPNAFSMLIEGQFFVELGDFNVYTARWYVDFGRFRERLDIEPSFNISGVQGVTPVQGSFIYYYQTQKGSAGQFSFTNGVLAFYNGASCQANSITGATTNPLKRVYPGNLFDSFFPATTASVSASTRYRGRGVEDGFIFDEYLWQVNTNFTGIFFSVTQLILVAMPQWTNNPSAGNYSFHQIPLAVESVGTQTDQFGNSAAYTREFDLSHYQPYNPGVAIFDAALLGCATTPDSPWYNIYGDQLPVVPPSDSSSSVSTSVIVGVVVGVGGGLLVLLLVALVCWRMRRSSPEGTRAKNDNELARARRLTPDAENSLNKASLNQREVSRLTMHNSGDNTTIADTAAGSTATSSDTF